MTIEGVTSTGVWGTWGRTKHSIEDLWDDHFIKVFQAKGLQGHFICKDIYICEQHFWQSDSRGARLIRLYGERPQYNQHTTVTKTNRWEPNTTTTKTRGTLDEYQQSHLRRNTTHKTETRSGYTM